MESPLETVRLEEREGCVILALDRPPLNVLNLAMMEELGDRLEEALTRKGLRVLVLRGRGKAFSAGVDVADHTAEKVEHMIDVFHRLFHLLQRFDGVTLAAVEGAALGGGCELACACDIVLAGERAKFGQPEIKVGVIPPVAAALFPQFMPLRAVFDFLIGGDTVGAEEARRMGLVNRVVPAEAFEAELEKEIARFTSLSAAVIRIGKRALRLAQPRAFAETLRKVERIYLGELMGTEDAHEGLAAFMEKRPAVWKHR